MLQSDNFPLKYLPERIKINNKCKVDYLSIFTFSKIQKLIKLCNSELVNIIYANILMEILSLYGIKGIY